MPVTRENYVRGHHSINGTFQGAGQKALMQRFRLAKAKSTFCIVSKRRQPTFSQSRPRFYLAAETNPRRRVPKSTTLGQIQLKPAPCRVRLPDCRSSRSQPHTKAARFHLHK